MTNPTDDPRDEEIAKLRREVSALRFQVADLTNSRDLALERERGIRSGAEPLIARMRDEIRTSHKIYTLKVFGELCKCEWCRGAEFTPSSGRVDTEQMPPG